MKQKFWKENERKGTLSGVLEWMHVRNEKAQIIIKKNKNIEKIKRYENL